MDYDLVGDVVFEPPLPPEELRRRFGYGIPIEERSEHAHRQVAEADDRVDDAGVLDGEEAKPQNRKIESPALGDAVVAIKDDSPLWTPEEYDLVDDIVFDPPLSPEEQRRRYGLGMTLEERLELARRQLAEGDDES